MAPLYVQSAIVEEDCQKNVNDCDFNAFITTLNNIIKILFEIAIAVLTIVIGWAGIKYITAGGDSGQIKEAHKMIWTAVKGFAIILCGYLIVEMIFNGLGATGGFNPFK